jgi:ElaB/YqjD/DUF883 family membrane-anchored ribosome-binding protein
MGIDAFRDWVFEDALNQNSWRSWLHEFYDEYVRDNPESFDIPLELSSRQSWERARLQSLVDSLNDKLERNRIEKKPQEEYDQIKEKIESLEETIQDIIDDPQGGYDESAIENEINNSVSEWENDIKGFIKNYGYDKDFIMDFVDVDKIAETVISSDGVGSILNSYDGDYDAFNINGTEYYVMRVS